MTLELIGRYPAANDREQMGRFLRHAFPLGLEPFAGLVSKKGEHDCRHQQVRGDSSVENALLALIH